MNIGISILINSDFNIWSNGLNQNILFLAQTLRSSEQFNQVVLINCGSGALPNNEMTIDGVNDTLKLSHLPRSMFKKRGVKVSHC